MYYYDTLKSGLKIAVNKTEGLRSVAFGVFVGVGSGKETEATNGYSHVIEHMVFKGTKTKTARQISEEMDELGGNLNAFTSKETTCFYNKVLPEKLDKAMELLSDIFFNATFNEEELEREKNVILEEQLMDEDIPDDVCHDLIAKAFFGQCALGYKVVGTKENVKNATREKLLDFKNKYYVPHNMCISFAGNIEVKTAKYLVEKYFENNFDNTAIKVVIPQLPVFQTYNAFKQVFKDTEQAHVSIAFKCFPTESLRFFEMKTAIIAFGGGMSSRLFQRIREQNGLAYSVFATNSSYVNNGYSELYLGTSPKNVKKAVDLLLEEVETVKKDGLCEKELERGKTQMLTTLNFGYESTMSLMIANGISVLLFDKSYDIEEKLTQVNNVTIENANNALNECLEFSTCSAAYVGRKDAEYHEINRFFNFK